MKTRDAVLWGMFVVIFLFVNYLAFQRETLAKNGRVVLVELAPVDPRSLIQGDYMRLRYSLSDEIEDHTEELRGFVVVRLDKNNVAHYVRIYDSVTPLDTDEILLPFRWESYDIRVGPKSFFFQEGQADFYDSAKYGELRVSDSGAVLLVGLRDANLNPLIPPE